MVVLRSLGGEAEAVRERTARVFQRYATLSAATNRIEEQADEEHAKQVTQCVHLMRAIPHIVFTLNSMCGSLNMR